MKVTITVLLTVATVAFSVLAMMCLALIEPSVTRKNVKDLQFSPCLKNPFSSTLHYGDSRIVCKLRGYSSLYGTSSGSCFSG